MRVRNFIFAAVALLLIGLVVMLQCSTEDDEPTRAKSTAENKTRPSDRAAKPDIQQLVRLSRPAREDTETPVARSTPGDDDRGPAPSDVLLAELSDEERETVRLLERVEEIELLYDRSDHAAVVARSRATLDEFPDSHRVLRKLIASSCILGKAEVASEYYPRITTPVDQKHVETVCKQHGIDLAEGGD